MLCGSTGSQTKIRPYEIENAGVQGADHLVGMAAVLYHGGYFASWMLAAN